MEGSWGDDRVEGRTGEGVMGMIDGTYVISRVDFGVRFC